MAYIELKNVYKTYKMGEVSINALDDTNFEIEKGELVVILGPSGAGKTTCLNILGGMDSPTKGDVLVDNVNIAKLSNKDLIKYRRNDIGFIFQFYNLVQNLTALENVELAVQLCKNYHNPNTILDSVGLKDRKQNFPSQLSGGEQQRVAIARAIAKNPKILLCDEPTGNLDSKASDEIMSILKKTNKDLKQTIIIITHNMEIAKVADRIIKIEDGKIDSEG